MDGTWECVFFCVINQIWPTSWSSKITYLYDIIYLQYMYYIDILYISASINHSIYVNIFQPFQLLQDFVYPIILQHTLSFWQSFILQIPKPFDYKLQAVHVHAWTCNVASTKKNLHSSTFAWNPRLDIKKHVSCEWLSFFSGPGPASIWQGISTSFQPSLADLRSDIFAFAREAAKNVSQSGVVGVA